MRSIKNIFYDVNVSSLEYVSCFATTVTTYIVSMYSQKWIFHRTDISILSILFSVILPVDIFPEHCNSLLLFRMEVGLNLLLLQIACLPLNKNKNYCEKKSLYKYYLLTESEVITGESQTETLMYWPSDSKANTPRPRSEIAL